MGIEGLIRGTGVHAAAVILSSTPLLDLIPMHRRDQDGAIITGFSYPQCEEMGLMKMDMLGLRNLGIIDHAVKLIRQVSGTDIDVLTLPLDDGPTYELLGRGDTLGVFQLDGGPMRALLRLMAPTRFEDIAAVLALYRPGPMAANAHINYAERKNGRQPITPIHPELAEALDPILGTTYHLLVYQEQIMAVARELAGYTLGGADLLRRAMGKKKAEILAKEFEHFQAGMRGNGYSDAAISALWDVMLPFSGYAFNKSHTAGYGLVSYWTAYLKANHPAEYMAALLESVRDDKDKSAIYLAECRRMGIKRAAARRQRVGGDVHPRRPRHPLRARRGAQRRRPGRAGHPRRARRARQGPRLLRVPRPRPARRVQQADDRVAHQGRRVRFDGTPAAGTDADLRERRRPGDRPQAQPGQRAGRPVRRRFRRRRENEEPSALARVRCPRSTTGTR